MYFILFYFILLYTIILQTSLTNNYMKSNTVEQTHSIILCSCNRNVPLRWITGRIV